MAGTSVSSSATQGRSTHRWKVLRDGGTFLLTLIVIALMIVVVKVYKQKGPFSPHQKTVFTGLFTALSIALALTFFTAFKSLAQASPRHILRRAKNSDGRLIEKGTPEQEEVLIHSIRTIDEWGSVLNVIFSAIHMRLVIRLGALLWLIFFLAAQGTVAAIGPQVSTIDGTNYTDATQEWGIFQKSNNTCFFYRPSVMNNYSCPFDGNNIQLNQELIQGSASAAGRSIGKVARCQNYTSRDDILKYDQTVDYYCGSVNGQTEFAYRFLEYNPEDKQKVYPHLTDRYIVASSGTCYRYALQNNASGVSWQGRGTVGSVNYWQFYFGNATYHDFLPIPIFSEFFEGTNYIYRGTDNLPQDNKNQSCGPRCIWMWAHHSPKANAPPDDSFFFRCPITVGEVVNATESAHELPDNMALLAAASIGLTGRPQAKPDPWTQFNFFPMGSPWAVDGTDPSDVGNNMAEHAIGAISRMASANPFIDANGYTPKLGAHLDVKWGNFGGILGAIGGTHLVMLCLTLFLSFKTYPDENGKAQ